MTTSPAPGQSEAVERVARAICKSGKFECGQGCCAPICMESLGDARRSCAHVVRVHGDLATRVLNAATQPAPGVGDAETAANLIANSLATKEDWSIGSMMWMAARLGAFKALAECATQPAQGMVCVPVAKPACAEDDHDWSAIHATHRCDKCGEER